MKKTILELTDEVNCRFHNLDISTRRKLVEELSFLLPYAFHMPAYKLGRWDGKVHFCDIGGRTYINLLERLIPIVQKAGYEIELVDNRSTQEFEFDAVVEDSYCHVAWPEGHRHAGEPIVLRDYQVDIINEFLKNPQGIQEISTGAGKCQPYSQKVLTPTGWKKMGDLVKGETVTTPNGKPAIIEEIYEPGEKEIYEITFQDGRKTRCCGDHIWKVKNIGWGYAEKAGSKKGGLWRKLTTLEVKSLIERTRRSIGIPLVTMEHDTKEVELPMDPWLLGFLLGDGSFRHSLGFSTADKEIVEKVKSKLSEGYVAKHKDRYDYFISFGDKKILNEKRKAYLLGLTRNNKGHIKALDKPGTFNEYKQALVEMGLWGCLSSEKFIPDAYFHGSREQRMELIRGLADSDGTIDKSSVYFSSTSQKLAEGYQRLVRSVGGIAKLTRKNNRSYVYKGERKACKDSFTVSTKYPRPWDLVSLERKRKATGYSYQYGSTLKLNISSVRKVGIEKVRCIMIDDPEHLYITDDYIVTHNTLVTAVLSHKVEPYGRSIVVVPSKSLVEQTEGDYRNLGLDVGVLYGDRKEYDKTHTICTWQSLESLLKRTKEGKADVTFEDFVDGVACVIVDEAHGARADVLKKLMTTRFGHIGLRWGMTGTIPTEDYEFCALTLSIGPLIHQIRAKELQDKGVLAKLDIQVLQLQDPVMVFKSYHSELKWIESDQRRLSWMADHIKEQTKEGNTLVLVQHIAVGERLRDMIDGSVFISGSVKTKDRKEEYDEVRTANDKIIIATYGVASVGIDIPRIFNLYLLEPGKSFIRVIQSIGRSIRTAEDKDFANVFDLASSHKYSKRHLAKRKKYYANAEYPYKIKKVDYIYADTDRRK